MSAQEDKSALPVGTVVRGYRLLEVLGSGGFGVTYAAEDLESDERVAVKEYLPVQFAVRDGTAVYPKSDASRADFEWGLDRFLAEAGMLTRFKHPNIVRVKSYLEANSTAYIVMEYEEGEPLDKLLDRRGKLTEAQLKRVLLPVADGLREVHARGVWHRDVKPANIFVRRSNESPVLLDFGAARNALGARSASMTAIVSPPYAPPEQYDSLSELGAYTDIYALSALCWQAITGEQPPESSYRQRLAGRGGDPLPLLAETRPPGYSDALLRAVDWGLRLDEEERPQSVAEWLDAMGEGEEQAAPPDPLPAQTMPSEPERTRPAYPDSPGGAEPEQQSEPKVPLSSMGESAEPVEPSAPQDDLDRALPRFLRRFLSGQYGLAKTFWQFGIAGGSVFVFQELVALALHFRELVSIYYFASLSVLGILYLLLVAVGVWSAARSEGHGIGAILARLLALLAVGLVVPSSFVLLNLPDLTPEPTPPAVVEPPAPAVESFTVVNRSADDIVVVRAVPTTMSNFGDNKLGTATIMPGRERRISLYGYDYGDACEFDVFIKTADERTHQEQANLCQRNGIVFGDGSEQDEQDDPPEVGAESIKADPKPDVKPPRPPPPASGQPLTVHTGPPDARVQITNIRPRYQPGIRLPPDSYVVKVTARGFDTVRRTLRHGDEPTEAWIGLPFRDCPVCPTMVEIPTGSFTMGTSRGEERFANEGPAHEVAIRSPIAVGVFEVSFGEWDACRNDGGCQRHLDDEGRGRGAYPVAQATLNDAKEYVHWLTVRTGRSYRLLSEAEWEYAARAGASSVRHWGSGENQCAYENGADVAAGREYSDWETASCTDGHVYTAASTDTRFSPNPWGLYHMLGNVSEWTEDCWHQNYVGAPSDGSPWKDNCDSGHTLRGGSWSTKPIGMRAPVRLSYDPAHSSSDVGFRVAVEIEP